MPGAPDGADADFAEDDSAPTANTLSAREVLVDPHVGHVAPPPPPRASSVAALIVRCNCSNFAWHD
jgi:hypothetical protein